MSNMYVSTHNHTYYSTLDGVNRPSEMAKTAKEMGMPAIAITDHGTLAGIPEFYEACTTQGIKPILGNEFYTAPDRRAREKFATPSGRQVSTYHLVLMAKNAIGYKNLIALNNIATTEGFYYRPRIDWESLIKHKDGLIATSACVGSELAQATLGGQPKEVAFRFKEAFGDDYYIEVMENEMQNDIQRNANRSCIPLAQKYGMKIIPTCDAHYLTADQYQIHGLAISMSQKKTISDPSRLKYEGVYHLKSPEEMARVFPDFMKNTIEIAEKVESFSIYDSKSKLPDLSVGMDALDTLRGMALAGLRKKGMDNQKYMEQLEHELTIIGQMNFATYFLITKEIISLMKGLNCFMGWGRGSAGGSIICYALGITDVDPIKWGLLFERFINPSRPDYPDVDIDIPQSRRDEVMSKIFERFGRDKVAHISTVHTLMPRLLLRDICRTLEMGSKEGEYLSSLVPHEVDAEKDDWEKVWAIINDPTKTELMKKVAGLPEGDMITKAMKALVCAPRQIGTHASGIVISSEPIREHLPVRTDNTGKTVTQYDMHHIDKFGFLKFDILGLKTLDLINGAGQDAGIDLKNLPTDPSDPRAKAAFTLIGEGRVVGVFQLDGSRQYMEFCKRMKPTTIEEVADLCALFRPGVMDSGQDTVYLNRRAGKESVSYAHPTMEKVLKATYGVCIFQEDMMRLAIEYAGYTQVEAENLRKGIAKKKRSIIDEHKDKFIERAKILKRDRPEEVWTTIEAGARYSWNKSHAASYGMVTYACAYLSANHPLPFFKHLVKLSDEADKTTYLSEAQSRGITVLPPDVNLSEREVAIEGNGLRLGMMSMKGIGDAYATKIMTNRPYDKILKLKTTVNKTVVSILYAAGAVKSIPDYKTHSPDIQADEVQILGISLGNLKEKYQDVITATRAITIYGLKGSGIIIAKIAEIKPKIDKRERKMAFLKVIDVHGPQQDVILFADAYERHIPKKGEVYAMVISALPNGGYSVRSMETVDSVRARHA